MFILLILFVTWRICSATAFYLRVYAPTNIALDSLRSRRGLKWAIPAGLVFTSAYWGAGCAVTSLIDDGGPGWLNFVAALFAWNGIKFAMLAWWSPILLARARLLERRSARRSAAGASSPCTASAVKFSRGYPSTRLESGSKRPGRTPTCAVGAGS